jgi:YD repeat-containing protein
MMRWLGLAARVSLASLTLSALGGGAMAAAAPAIEYAYDERGRLVVVADQQGNVAVYVYDAVGNIVAIRRIDSADLPGAVAIGVVTPGRGRVGTIVSIFGKGFAGTTGQNVVTFNGLPAAVSDAAPNRLTVTVPPGATSGPIRVTAPPGTATSPSPFRVLGTLTIDPPSAVVVPGGTQQFSAFEGPTPAAVLWSVNGVVGGEPTVGSISPTGVFTAPGPGLAPPPSVAVTAISRDDSALTATATVTILPPRPVLLVAHQLSVAPAVPALQRTLTTAVSLAIAEPGARAAFAPAVTVTIARGEPALAVADSVAVVIAAGHEAAEAQ